jgi:formylglycine-generating enzyme
MPQPDEGPVVGPDSGTGDVSIGDANAPDTSDCPGTSGPASLRVAGEGGVSFCVDTTEVTNAQYAQFLAANVPTGSQQTECAWNSDYTPSTWPNPAGSDNQPVRDVNWCDAVAYCGWAGKRLCGAIAGGPNAVGDYQNPAKGQWLFACSHGGDGKHSYAYGNTYVPGACDDLTLDGSAPLDVASEPACVGGFAGVYDMSGNVWELEDSCYSVDGGVALDQCVSRAGSYHATGPQTECTFAFTVDRSFTADDTGFRCCSNP